MAEDYTKSFRDSLNSRHKSLIAAMQQLLDCIICRGEVSTRVEHVKVAVENARIMRQVLGEVNEPSWLNRTITGLERYLRQPDTQEAVNEIRNILTKDYRAIEDQKWSFERPHSIGFDLEEVFRIARDENAIPQLFDEVIEILLQIAASDEIDSIKLQKELQDVIEMLKASRTGTYGQIRTAWIFFTTWTKNSLWEAGKTLPLVGPIVKGLHTTIEKGSQKIGKTNEDVNAKMQAFASVKLRLVNQQKTLRLTDETVFEVKTDEKPRSDQ